MPDQEPPEQAQAVPTARPTDAGGGRGMRDRLLGLGVLLTCVAAAVLAMTCLAGPAAAQPTPGPGPVQLSGIYQLIVADPAPVIGAPRAPVEQSFLLVGERAYRLHLPPTARPRPGAHITVTATLSGSDVTATAVSAGITIAAAPAVTGTTKVLVILAYWTAPDAVTPDSAGRQMFTDSSGWYSQASYGALTQVGSVTPWLRIPGPAGNQCYADMRNEMTTAKSAALAAGYDSAQYDRIVLYFPNDSAASSDCSGYAGWASVSGTEVWLNGYIDRRVTVHEQGHNYGLMHANTLACKDTASGSGIALASPANCVSTEYGDDFDAMGGSSYVGSFSAGEKNQLSWLSGHKAALSPGSTVTIAPFQTAAPVNAAYFTTPGGRTYWLEYRQRAGIDASLPVGVTDGVLIHLDDAVYRPTVELLDQKPATYNTFVDATLSAGSSWTTPDGYTFLVTTVTPAGATVRLISGTPTVPGAPTAMTVSRNDAAATGTISWSPPASDGGFAITGYRVSRDGADATGAGPSSTIVSAATRSSSFGNLRPGATYTLSVGAINAAGDGPTVSGSVTMSAALPGAPTGIGTIITTSAGSGTLSWAPPASDGGSTVTGYRVSRNGIDATGAGPLSTLVSAATRSFTFAALRPGVSYTVSVRAVNAVGTGLPASATVTVQVAGAVVPVAPARIADSRTSLQIPGAVPALGSVQVQITGRGGIPSTGVAAAVLTVTAVAPVTDGYLTVWPAGIARTDTSSVNFVAGQNIPNTAIVPVGGTGAVGVFNGSAGGVHVLVDVTGYIADGTATEAGMFVPVGPSRVADSRVGQQISGAVPSGGIVTVQLTNRAGIPGDGVSAVVLNVTAVAPTGAGYVTVWPAGTPRTSTSNLNFVAGQTIPNTVIVQVGSLDSAGAVAMYNGSGGSVQLLVDVSGYFRQGSPELAGAFASVTPTRIADSRAGLQLDGALPGLGTAELQITGRGGLPLTGVAAVVLNVTAVFPTNAGYLTVWPAGIARTTTSNLNFQAGQTIPNTVIVPVGALDSAGRVSIFNGSAGPMDLVVDVAGYILIGAAVPS